MIGQFHQSLILSFFTKISLVIPPQGGIHAYQLTS